MSGENVSVGTGVVAPVVSGGLTGALVGLVGNANLVVARMSKAGKLLGTRVHLNGETRTASQLRADGKALGLTGRALTDYVNASLKGDMATAAHVRAAGFLELARTKGMVPEFGEFNTKDTMGHIKLRKPKGSDAAGAPKASKKAVELQQALDKERKRSDAMEAKLAEVLALLAKVQGAAPAEPAPAEAPAPAPVDDNVPH